MNEPKQETFFLDPEPAPASPEVAEVVGTPTQEPTPTPDPDSEKGTQTALVANHVPQIRQRKDWSGRIPKVTPQIQEEVCKYVSEGNYFEVACSLAGVLHETAYAWIRRGRDPLAPNHKRYKAFYHAVLGARAKAEADGVSQVRGSGSLDWRAAAWWLERAMPDRWGRAVIPPEDFLAPAPEKPGSPGIPKPATEDVTRMLAALSPEAILDLAAKCFRKPEQVVVVEDGMAQDVQAADAPATLEEKARMA